MNGRTNLWLPCIVAIIATSVCGGAFLDQQRGYARFKVAEREKAAIAAALFESKGLSLDRGHIFLRIFKKDMQLELWAAARDRARHVLIRNYEICQSSGALGPKRRKGDGQVPEGCYTIARFNPASNFYMSLGVSYPNKSDMILGSKGSLGGDIFIHGDCVTIGCVPITDPMIKELYLICAHARDNGQREIPVHIFPLRMDEGGMAYLRKNTRDAELLTFWLGLSTVYRAFESTRTVPVAEIGADGQYRVR